MFVNKCQKLFPYICFHVFTDWGVEPCYFAFPLLLLFVVAVVAAATAVVVGGGGLGGCSGGVFFGLVC